MIKGFYKCECGECFDNPQKFNGHRSQCGIHLMWLYAQNIQVIIGF